MILADGSGRCLQEVMRHCTRIRSGSCGSGTNSVSELGHRLRQGGQQQRARAHYRADRVEGLSDDLHRQDHRWRLSRLGPTAAEGRPLVLC